MKPKLFISQPIPAKGTEMLSAHFEVEQNGEKRVLSKEELIARIKGKDALLCILTDKIDADVLAAEPNLKIVSNFAVGFNNIDIPAATEKGIVVTNTPGVLDDTTADFTLALLLAVARRVAEGDRVCRANEFRGWEPEYMLGYDVHGKTLGIVGLGRIGKEVAKRAKNGFGMKIIYSDAVRQEAAEQELGVEFVELDELLKQSDFVSLHVPLIDETKHMISTAQLELMKSTACLLNMARGPVVDEQALIAALKEKKIFGAALDVYENEPEIPAELRALDNVVMAPHLGSATVEARDAMAELSAQNLIDFFSGNKPAAIVNEDAFEKAKARLA